MPAAILERSKLWSFVIISYHDRTAGHQIFTMYIVMTCGLLQGQYGGDHCICQSASNLSSITYN